MASLPSDLRKVLENAVVSAREQATTAAGAALKRLAIATKEYPQYLSPEETVLRRNLRAAARQLGDRWNAEKQSFTSLTKITHEVAYEHWHRMLFARFLAENNLLMHPEHGVSVDLATVAELAQEEAAKTKTKADAGVDKWAMAGRFASKMLSRIFRPDDPALAVQLAPEHQQALEKILESLPPSVFIADDSLGWVYQFWQSAEKERVNNGVKAGDKITGETLPAVTQLFTEHYMVLFLLHNTVGAWWAGKQIAKFSKAQTDKWQTEADVRSAVELPGYSFDYLRFVKDESTGAWRPAAGTFDGWPKAVKQLKLLDPCCGSGHFLVAGLELLLHLRMAEEGMSRRDAAAAVIADNLFGLELDARCTQIAAFNVALAAWKFAGDFFPIDSLHIACSGLAPSASEKDWLKLADAAPPAQRGPIRLGLTALHRSFADAPEIGSLIQIGGITTVGAADYETLQPFLINALASEDEDAHEQAITAQGMTKAAEILAGEYTLVITNVPYLGRGKQSPALQAWADEHQPDAKADLATMFISRSMDFLAKGGTLSVVSPQNWLFLGGYKSLRARLLKDGSWNIVASLGSGAFETIGGAVVNVSLVSLTRDEPNGWHEMAGIDASIGDNAKAKALLLRGNSSADLRMLLQASQLKNPDVRVQLDVVDASSARLGDVAESYQGIVTGDLERFRVLFWEPHRLAARWVAFRTTISGSGKKDGLSGVLLWEGGAGQLSKYAAVTRDQLHDMHESGNLAWNRRGVAVNRMTNLYSDGYLGEHFDNNVAVIIPKQSELLEAIYSFCIAPSFNVEVRKLDRSLKVTNRTLTKVPFDLAHWQAVAAEKYPNGLPEPESDDPTQWLFHGRPEASSNPLQVAVARLLGYRWPAELEDAELADVAQGQNDFPHNEKNAAASKRIAQELKESRSVEKNAAASKRIAQELKESRSVEKNPAGSKRIAQELKESLSVGNNLPASKTIAQELKESPGQTKMRLSQRARDLVARCGELSALGDDDGVVPLVAINGEPPGDQRVRALLEAAYGDKWTPGLLNDLLANAGSAGKSLEDWLKNDFFAQHCSLFHQRPFIWQIWDGKKDGFNILVNYHKLAGGENSGVNSQSTKYKSQKSSNAENDQMADTSSCDFVNCEVVNSPQGVNSQSTKYNSQKSSNAENDQMAAASSCDFVNCDVVSSPQGRRLLEKIVYTYLGDWITQQQAAAKQGVAGADTRLKAAQDLQKKLEAIITGEPPFDIFVRWKPLHEQPIGWNPDINDGVRMNIRPFITANVLRGKVNVKWTKDRGKEPASIRPKGKFPWFWKCPEENPPTDFAGGAEFTGERLNNLHYTIATKQTASAAANSQSTSHKSQRSSKG